MQKRKIRVNTKKTRGWKELFGTEKEDIWKRTNG